MNKRFLSSVSTALLVLSLVACGGGGGGGGTPPPVPVLPQGLWDGEGLVTYVLPTATGAGEVWALPADTEKSVLFGSLQVSGSGFAANTARYMTGVVAEAADAQLSLASAGTALTLTGSIPALSRTISLNNMTASPVYERVATMSDWQGCWQLAGDLVASEFCVSSLGVVSGFRGACTLSGTVSLRPEAKSVVNVSVQESSCSEAKSLSGIGAFARSAGVVVEAGRMLALKTADNSLRSLVGLFKPN